MKKVLFSFRMPHGWQEGKTDKSAFFGGIAEILSRYLERESYFQEQQYQTELFSYDNEKLNKIKISKIFNIVYAFFQERAAADYAKKNDVDLIHIHSSRKWLLFKDLLQAGYIKKKCPDKKVVLSVHFAELDKILYTKDWMKKKEIQMINQNLDRLILLSRKTRDQFIEAGVEEKKIEVLYTFHQYEPLEQEVAVQEKIKLLFVGSIDTRKGILDLMDVMAKLDDRYELHVCGQATEPAVKEAFEKKCRKLKEKVVFHGYIRGEEKKKIYEEADLLVLPSYGEGMPLVILEAMALGCGIVSTDVGAIREVIRLDNGILVEPGNKAQLQYAIEQICKNPERLQEIKRKNIEKGKEFHIDQHLDKVIGIYNDVLGVNKEEKMETCKGAFAEIHSDLESYYPRWYHEKPIMITKERQEELRELHRVLYKCVEHMAAHYQDYLKYMPLSEDEVALLQEQSKYPFLAGTFRPDYLISEEGDLVLCEITSRFFAHGIFMSYFSEYMADRFMEKHPGEERESFFEEMLSYMLGLPGNKKKIAVLKSADRTSEIPLYVPFYEHYGYEVQIYEAPKVEENIENWKDAFVIGALNQKDLLSMKPETCAAMMKAGMYNDFRTIFLIHDKRFMNLWFRDEFTDQCLTKEETAFLRAHAIPTYCYLEEYSEIWEDARLHKDCYILKPHCLGKSEKVFAGVLTTEEKWAELWENRSVEGMILQPFLAQKTYHTMWEGQEFEDYICGMMLCVNDRYFDSGLFRASSTPVTNVGDDRRACPVLTDSEEVRGFADVL